MAGTPVAPLSLKLRMGSCLNMMKNISRLASGVLLTAVCLTVSTTAVAEMIPQLGPEGVTPPGQVYEFPALPAAAGVPEVACYS